MNISEKDVASEIFKLVSESLANYGYKCLLKQDSLSYLLSRGENEIYHMYFNEQFNYFFIEEYHGGYSGPDVYSTPIRECCTVGDTCKNSIISEIGEIFGE